MKNLIGFSLLLKILILFLIFNSFSAFQVFSNDKILETVSIFYNLDEEGNTSFKYQIILSAQPNYGTAISQYTINFPFEEITFASITSEHNNLKAQRDVVEGVTKLTVDLEKKLLNIANPIQIEIIGTIKDKVLKESAGTKILTIPGQISTIKTYKIEITYPNSFGEITTPGANWTIQRDDNNIRLITFDNVKIVNLVWGDTIIYNFEIKKNLFNGPNESSKTFDINIPKAHHNQKIIFSRIEPIPNVAYQDTEGNLFFSYELKSDTEVNIEIGGQIHMSSTKDSDTKLQTIEKPILTEQIGYWLLEDAYEINRLRVFLAREGITEDHIDKMNTDTQQQFYALVYQYVLQNLEFSTIKTSSMESNIRQGANTAITNRTQASPEDYVDVLSAIYRRYGVPTKMIEGYVTMFNQNFYHSWLEFWNEEGRWQTIDPALEAYSGQDFFHTDLNNHIVILTRGYNYLRPRMMFFNHEDFFIEIASDLLDEDLSLKHHALLNPMKKTPEDIMGMLEIQNTGNTILSLQNFAKQEQITFANYNALQIVLPGQTIYIPFSINLENEKDVMIRYTSINGEEKLDTISLNFREQQFWWWSPLVNILKITIITIIVYIIYIISNNTYKWIRKYYQ